jgi:antitoxin VapB
MPHTAKIFRNGRSLAVRLPAEFRFEESEVFIRRDVRTGDVILSRRPESWKSFFELVDRSDVDRSDVDRSDVPQDFLSDRGDQKPQKRDVL